MRQVLCAWVVAFASALVPTGPVDAKPMHDVPYEPLPETFEELPEGAPTTLPWWQDGVLHVGGKTIETPYRRINHRNGTTVVGKGSGYPASKTEWYLVVGTRLKPLVTTGTASLPKVSANGRWIAWLKETYFSDPYDDEETGVDTRHDLVVYDVARREVAGTYTNRRIVYSDGINGMGYWALNNRGRVAFGVGGKDFIWKAGRRPVAMKGRSYEHYLDLDTWPRGVMQYASLQEKGIYSTVDRKGRVEKQGLVPDWTGTWSRTGDAYAYRTDGGSFWVDRIDAGLRVQLGVPDIDDYVRVVGWESDTEVVVWWHNPYADNDISVLARCDVVSGDCERVTGGPEGDSPAEMQTSR